MGCIMVWWCLPDRPGLRPSVTVFRTFLLHAWTYWAENLDICLFNCTKKTQAEVSSICINFCRSYAPFGTLNTWKTQFSHFSPTFADILSWNFAYEFIILHYRSSWSVINLRKFSVGVMPLLEAKSRKYQGEFEVKGRVKTWQVRGIRSQQLEH